ncbi:MAG: helix-turn-helix domain-containing protein [bacterium]|nr:helix-turn-helix domain-containing protein [bacterium]
MSHKFAARQVADLTKRIESGTSTLVLGIPGAGITLFLKHMSTQTLGKSVYVDVFSLPNFKTSEFFKLLLLQLGGQPKNKYTNKELVTECTKQLELLKKNNNKVIIYVAGFDQLKPEFSAEFFQYLRSLRSLNPSKIVFILGVCRNLDTILPLDLVNTDLSLFTSVFYLKPFQRTDLSYLLSLYGPNANIDVPATQRLIKLSGGHFQLLQLMLRAESPNNPTKDLFIQLVYKNIYTPLSTPQKAIIRKIASNGSSVKPDDYLINVGIVQKKGDKYQLFSPIFADCVRAFSAPKLPIKERRLLSILKSNRGRMVSKREIFDAVWRDQEVGTEWALNALIYRLRKHPAFTSQNYGIESHKKLGYSLSKNL